MEFRIKRKVSKNNVNYSKEKLDIAYNFARKLLKEIGDFVKVVVLHGADSPETIKIIAITDDISFEISHEMVETYRIISEKIIESTDSRITLTTMKLSSFWEHVKIGDPHTINLLREGVALIDMGFFEPVQFLLENGRIRPSEESVWTYFYRAPTTLQNSRYHLMQATIDLYWSASNISHAALMKLGIIPPSPEHLADFVDTYLAQKGLVSKTCPNTMRTLYDVSKMIIHKDIADIKGEQYDEYRKAAFQYLAELQKVVEDQTSNPVL